MRTWNRAISAWSPPRPWRPSCCANGAASPARPQILGDLFDRLGLRRIRAARLGRQPDGLRLELRRVSRSFCHGSIISHRVRGNAEQKSVHITTHPIAGEIILEGYLLRVRGWGRKAARSMPAWSEGIMAPRQTKAKLMKRKTGKPMLDWILKHG